jgi:hypothetical protein
MALTSSTRPHAFWIHVDRFAAPHQRVWAVETQGQYLTARTVECQVPVVTVFRGRFARQPIAYLRGKGLVEQHGAHILITPGANA